MLLAGAGSEVFGQCWEKRRGRSEALAPVRAAAPGSARPRQRSHGAAAGASGRGRQREAPVSLSSEQGSPLLQGRFFFFSCVKQPNAVWCLLRWSVCQFVKGASVRCCTQLLNTGVLLFVCQMRVCTCMWLSVFM